MDSLNLKIIKDYIDKKAAVSAPGKSAYRIAVDNGFIGTEEQWLNTLKGEKGDIGDNYILTEQDKIDIADIVLSLLPDADIMLFPEEEEVNNG